MAADILKRAASFETEIDAQIAAQVLEQHEIEATLQGVSETTALGIGGGLLSKVDLLVWSTQLEKAKSILESVESDSRNKQDSLGDWICEHCGSEVEGTMEVCWQCCESRTESSAVAEESGPPASPPVGERGKRSTPRDVNGLIKRAFYAAIIGLITLPVLLHFYSMFLLFQAAASEEEFSNSQSKKFFGTMCLNLVACALYGLFLYSIFGQ